MIINNLFTFSHVKVVYNASWHVVAYIQVIGLWFVFITLDIIPDLFIIIRKFSAYSLLT